MTAALPPLLALSAGLALVPNAAAGDEPDMRGLIAVAPGDCARLVGHAPGADVAYRPGVDVRGRPVVPADLGGGAQLAMPEEIVIEIELDLLERLGLPIVAGGYAGNAVLGRVTVRDGRAYFNGQPMSDFDQAVLDEACRAQGRR